MNLSTTQTVTSEKLHGVSFVVKRLNVIERARRDAPIAAATNKRARLLQRLENLRKKYLSGQTDEERQQQLDALDPDVSAEMAQTAEEAAAVYFSEIMPAHIMAGLVSVSGIEIDGQPATVETVLAHAPDELLYEIAKASEDASALTGDQTKN